MILVSGAGEGGGAEWEEIEEGSWVMLGVPGIVGQVIGVVDRMLGVPEAVIRLSVAVAVEVEEVELTGARGV